MEASDFFVGALKAAAILSEMSDDQIAVIAGCAKNVRFPAKTKIFAEGGPADQLFIVREGRVAVDMESVHRGILTVHTVGPGDVLGWSWLFPPYRWHYNARAVHDTKAIALDADCLRTKAEADPALGYELMKCFSAVMLTRLEATRMQLMNIYDVPTPA